MRYKIFWFFVFFSSHIVHAQIAVNHIEIAPIYSTGTFNWSIAGNQDGEDPNVMSELNWRDLKSYGITVNTSWNIKKLKPYISFVQENIFSGLATDSDYDLDDRQGLTYSQIFRSKRGMYSRLSILNHLNSDENLFLGVSLSRQNLSLFHEEANLNSRYNTFWIGLELRSVQEIAMGERFDLHITNAIRLSRYAAKARWIYFSLPAKAPKSISSTPTAIAKKNAAQKPDT